MKQEIDYFFWLNSDWAYLGLDRLRQIAAENELVINYMPVDLPDVYRRTGGQLLANRGKGRQRYREIELQRWCRRLGVTLNPSPRYMCPDAEAASRIFIAAGRLGFDVAPLHQAILRAEWCEERDISDPKELHAILKSVDMDVGSILEEAADPRVETMFRHFTDAAVMKGVFGSPSYIFNDELFWGQDRIEMLNDEIKRQRSWGRANASYAASEP